jgi:hypothetical protein
MKLEFARQIFEKYSNIKFHKYPSSGSPVLSCRQTDRQTDYTWRSKWSRSAILQTHLKTAPPDHKRKCSVLRQPDGLSVLLHVGLVNKICLQTFSPVAQQPPVGQGPLIIEASRSHSDTPHSVGLLWTSDQPDAEVCTWQHTTLTRDRHPCPRWDSNPQSQQTRGRRQRGHWHQLFDN